jgi:hypothetical protein
MSQRKRAARQSLGLAVGAALAMGALAPVPVSAAGGKGGSLTLAQKLQFKAQKLRLNRQLKANQKAVEDARPGNDRATSDFFAANSRLASSTARLAVLRQELDRAETQDRAANTRNGVYTPSLRLQSRQEIFAQAQQIHEAGPVREFQAVETRYLAAADRFRAAGDALAATKQALAVRKTDKANQRAANLEAAEAKKRAKSLKNRPPSLEMWGPAASQSDSSIVSFSSSPLGLSGSYLFGDWRTWSNSTARSSDRSSSPSDRIDDPLPATPGANARVSDRDDASSTSTSTRSSTRVSDRIDDPLPIPPGPYGRIPQGYVHQLSAASSSPSSPRAPIRSQYVSLPVATATAIQQTAASSSSATP